MDRKVKVVQFGCGRMGSICMKYALDKGADIIGAFDMKPEVIGKDISVRAGGAERGVKISDSKEFEEKLPQLKPDIVVVTTQSLVKDVYPVLKICAENGINAITSCEEAI